MIFPFTIIISTYVFCFVKILINEPFKDFLDVFPQWNSHLEENTDLKEKKVEDK